MKSIHYLCVFEQTKAGEPHLHILARTGYIPQKWLSEQMRSLMDAPIVDIRAIHNGGQVAGYVAKYIGKNPHRFIGCKRYWMTRGYDLLSASERDGRRAPAKYWEYGAQAYSHILTSWTLAGYWVVKDDEEHAHYDDSAEMWNVAAAFARIHGRL